MEVVNQMFRRGGHHCFAPAFIALSSYREPAGFAGATRWKSGEAPSTELCLVEPADALETLYVEARKPLEPGAA